MDIRAAIINRLTALGYAVAEGDLDTIGYYIGKAGNVVRMKTNQPEVPEGLLYVWADMAAGMFLQDKKLSGALDCLYDFSAPAKSISEGDTSVTFAIAGTGSFEDQFDATLARMVKPDEEVFLAFRRLVW